LFGAGVPSTATEAAGQQQQGNAAAELVPGSDAYAALAGLWRSSGAAANGFSADVQQPQEEQQPDTGGTAAEAQGPLQQQQLEQSSALLAGQLSQRFSSDATATVETAVGAAVKAAVEDQKPQQQQQQQQGTALVDGQAVVKQEPTPAVNAQQQQQQAPGQQQADADDDEVEALMALGQLGQDFLGQQQLQQQWSQGGGNGSKRPAQKSSRGGDADQVRLARERSMGDRVCHC
jgi:hypothetical protein